MIDTHCHLTDPRLLDRLDGVLSRAAAAGVTAVVTVGTDFADARAVIDLCRRLSPDAAGRAAVRCAIGVHPNESADATPGDVEAIAALSADPSVVALGEMGLDHFRGGSTPADRDRQSRIFAAQLAVADRLRRPVIIHARDAVADTLAVMADRPSVPAVFHCFTGTDREAADVLARGYLLGFTGAVTFKRADALRDVARNTPADRLLVETDGPYLSPEPVRREKVCEPAFVAHTLAAVAAARGVSAEELDAVTTTNARRFYDLV